MHLGFFFCILTALTEKNYENCKKTLDFYGLWFYNTVKW